jgi:hypothetical protein
MLISTAGQPITKVLLQVGWTLKHQLCATINSGSGSTNKAQQKFLTSSIKQNQAAVPGRQL